MVADGKVEGRSREGSLYYNDGSGAGKWELSTRAP